MSCLQKQELCPSRRQALQKSRIIRSTPKICLIRKRQRDLRRNTLRLLWKSRRFKNTSRQSIPHRFLLANRFERRRRTCQKMQRLSNVRKKSSCASSQSHMHPTRLAFLLLGARSSRTSQESKGRFRVHLCSN